MGGVPSNEMRRTGSPRIGHKTDPGGTREFLLGSTALLVYLACSKLLLHFLFNGRYGYFRDEFYYLACGEHLAWGYVDQPPLIAVVARLSRWLLGDSLFAIRFFPAVAGASVVFLTGRMARALGGGRFAQFLGAVAILLAPAYLAFDSFLSMNAFEPVFWMLCAYCSIRILKGADPRLWLLFGAVAGLGLLNKHTILVFGFSLFVGLLLTSGRSQLRSKWIWLGGLVALVIFLPNLFWEARHDWPQIEVVRNAQEFKNYPISPLQFLIEQILFLHPLAFPVWLAGLAWFFFAEDGKRFQYLGGTYVVLFAIFVGLKGKSYYPVPAYPMLMAAGGVLIEQLVKWPRRRWLKFAFPSLLIAGGIATLPFGVPVLPVETFVRYQNLLPLARSVQAERGRRAELPQLYADMFGWENLVATVAKVFHSLPPEEQTKCAIFTDDYGEAGAIDFFGRAYHLPKAISGHNNYFLWGAHGHSGEVVIAVGVPAEELKKIFREVEAAAIISSPYAMPSETDLPVYICRNIRAPLEQLWPSTKHYI